MDTKFIFITGGVVSSLGKGITAASLGNLLKSRGKKVVIQKMDPYINLGPGNLSPLQHGEVYVTDDGAETDLDIGHYERYTGKSHGKYSNCTAGRIYYTVIEKERVGEYGGNTVQVIPHITDEIKSTILAITSAEPDVVITEIGGTVGDMESTPFIEAIRQMRGEVGPENCCFIHVTLLPYIASAGELKTKPTQHSVKALRSLGIQPDIIVCRSEMPIADSIKKKVALFCNVTPESVVANIDCSCIYKVPLLLHAEGLDDLVCKKLGLEEKEADLTKWKHMIQVLDNPKHAVTIGLVGKYVELHDAYFSAAEAIAHGGIANEAAVRIKYFDTGELADFQKAREVVASVDGILLPAAHQEAMEPGHVNVAKACLELDKPCLFTGAALEALALAAGGKAPFTEGEMRMGAQPMKLMEGTRVHAVYGTRLASERHRLNRYLYQKDAALLGDGLIASGIGDEGRVEALEAKDRAFAVGVASHPEFKSRPDDAHPLYTAFIAAALGN